MSLLMDFQLLQVLRIHRVKHKFRFMNKPKWAHSLVSKLHSNSPIKNIWPWAMYENKNAITLCLFHWKPSVKIVFHIFQCLVAHKKTGQWKTIFGQWKILIKIRLIYYRLFSKFFFFLENSLSLSHVLHLL